MRLLPYALAIGIVTAILFLGPSLVAAQNQNHPTQFGGGMVSGFVYGYTMYDQLIPIEWAQVTASSSAFGTFKTSSYANGGYDFYLPTGTYNLTVDEQGFVAQSKTIAVSDGASISGFNFFLERSNVPIPEFPTQVFSVIMLIAVAGALVAKKATKRKHLPN